MSRATISPSARLPTLIGSPTVLSSGSSSRSSSTAAASSCNARWRSSSGSIRRPTGRAGRAASASRPRRGRDRRDRASPSRPGGPGRPGCARKAPIRSPSSPSSTFACRSRFEPSGAAASLTCSARSRSRPIRASTSARISATVSGSPTSTPDTNRWHESRQRPSRGWRSSASTRIASSSIERPIVPPAPAEFSSRSHVRSEQRSSTSRSAGHRALDARLQAGAQVRADVEDDPVRPDRAGRVDGRAHRRAALAVDRPVLRGEVAEVERVHEHRTELRFLAPLAEAGEVFLRVLGKPPRARALREELHGVCPDLDRPVERALDPS